MPRLLFALALGAWLLARSGVAVADPAAAEALFQEGRRALEAGDLDAACEKFEASFALEASSGTQLNLAACRTKQGRNATAWAHFVAAERLAAAQGRADHQLEATERAQALEADLSYLTIRVSQPAAGLEVRRNGQRIASGSFGAKIPVDPGRFVIEASAAGYVPVRRQVTVGRRHDHQVVELPPLLPVAPAPASTGAARPAPTQAGPSAAASGSNAAAAWIAGSVGLTGLSVGGVFGALALSSDASARRACDDRTTDCPQHALAHAETRDRQALISTLGVGVGLAGIAVATWLILSGADAPDAQPAAMSAGVSLGRASVFMNAGGSF
jgi:tetratricopeptide (TPR) repeat protein